MIIGINLLSGFTASVNAQNILNNDNYQEIFQEANKAYKNKHYLSAIKLYNKLLNKGFKNGNLYYNLANAYLKNESIGNAIANYKNAQVFLPRNADIKANLKFTREQVPQQLSSSGDFETVLNILAFWYYDLNMVELVVLTIFINIITFGILIINLFYRNDYLKISIYILFVILGVLIISSSLKLINNYRVTEAVIATKEVDLKSGNDKSYSTLYTVKEGIEVKIEEQSGDWYKILLPDGRKGWIDDNNLAIVNAHM
jgi:tetratricopeptide (TPR) repeat protein